MQRMAILCRKMPAAAGSLRKAWRATISKMPSVALASSVKPSFASLIAGAINAARDNVPYFTRAHLEAERVSRGCRRRARNRQSGLCTTLPCAVLHHVRGGGAGGLFAEIEEGAAAVGEAEGHEAAAADVAGRGVDDGQRVADGDGGVYRVAALAEDVGADVRGEVLGGDDHAVGGGNWGRVGGQGGGGQEQEGGEGSCAWGG